MVTDSSGWTTSPVVGGFVSAGLSRKQMRSGAAAVTQQRSLSGLGSVQHVEGALGVARGDAGKALDTARSKSRDAIRNLGGIAIQLAAGRSDMDGPRLEVFRGTMGSPNCNYSANVTVAALVIDQDRLQKAALSYSLVATVSVIVQVGLTLAHLYGALTQSHVADGTSMMSIGIMALQDSFLTLMHVVMSVFWSGFLGPFAVLAFF